MEQINNDQTIRDCSRVLGHQVENTPQLDTSKITLVANVNPAALRRCNIIKSNTGTNANATIFTTPTDKDFYLVYAQMSRIKTAISDDSIDSLLITEETSAQDALIVLTGITLTTQEQNIAASIPIPIKLKRGSNIVMGKTATTVGTNVMSGTIAGYTVESVTTL